jgi:YVTN family beta-propeller protein
VQQSPLKAEPMQMKRVRVDYRLILLLLLLGGLAAREALLEHHFQWLKPGMHMMAYVGNTGDGTVSVIDLARLGTLATVNVGPSPSGLRAHPTRKEIWGVSAGGYAWVLDETTNEVAAKIPVGAAPFAVDFSVDGQFAYVAASGANTVTMIDCASRRVVARARAGAKPWVARAAPNGKWVLVTNRDDATVSLLDAASLEMLEVMPTAPHPEQIVILPDNSKAFISSVDAGQLSVVRLPTPDDGKRADAPGELVANIDLGGTPGDLILKPDGGELYVPSPDAHGLMIVNTATNEVGDYLLLGLEPTAGVLTGDSQLLYVSDSGGGRVTPIQIQTRQAGISLQAGEGAGAARFTPGEEMLVVVNHNSNDVSILRTRTGSLITLVPVGRAPRDLTIREF